MAAGVVADAASMVLQAMLMAFGDSSRKLEYYCCYCSIDRNCLHPVVIGYYNAIGVVSIAAIARLGFSGQ